MQLVKNLNLRIFRCVTRSPSDGAIYFILLSYFVTQMKQTHAMQHNARRSVHRAEQVVIIELNHETFLPQVQSNVPLKFSREQITIRSNQYNLLCRCFCIEAANRAVNSSLSLSSLPCNKFLLLHLFFLQS